MNMISEARYARIVHNVEQDTTIYVGPEYYAYLLRRLGGSKFKVSSSMLLELVMTVEDEDVGDATLTVRVNALGSIIDVLSNYTPLQHMR